MTTLPCCYSILLLVKYLCFPCVCFLIYFLFNFFLYFYLEIFTLVLNFWTFCNIEISHLWDCQIFSHVTSFCFSTFVFLWQTQNKLSPLAKVLLEVIPVGDNLREKHSSPRPHLISPCALLSGWSSSFSGWLCQGPCAGIGHHSYSVELTDLDKDEALHVLYHHGCSCPIWQPIELARS